MWTVVLLLFIAAANAVPVTTVSPSKGKCSYSCPPHFVRLSQQCYYISQNNSTWHEAYFNCRERRSNIATIRSANQDKILRNALNKNQVQSEKWIGGMYDWAQMSWKWVASGKPIKYKGFYAMGPEDKDQLKWQCIMMDPALQNRWNHRSCLEQRQYICQTRARKVARKERKKLDRQFNANKKYNKLNEVPVPSMQNDKWNKLKANGHNEVQNDFDNNTLENTAFALRNNTVTRQKPKKHRKRKHRRNRNRIPCDNQVVVNGTQYNNPQPKSGKKRRSHKHKGENNTSIENLKAAIYYSAVPASPLHPRIIVEDFS